MLLSRAIFPVLFLSLKFPLTNGVVISCRIWCMLSSRSIVTVLFLSLKCNLTAGVVISCHSYRSRCLDAPYIANHADITQTKVLYLPW